MPDLKPKDCTHHHNLCSLNFWTVKRLISCSAKSFLTHSSIGLFKNLRKLSSHVLRHIKLCPTYSTICYPRDYAGWKINSYFYESFSCSNSSILMKCSFPVCLSPCFHIFSFLWLPAGISQLKPSVFSQLALTSLILYQTFSAAAGVNLIVHAALPAIAPDLNVILGEGSVFFRSRSICPPSPWKADSMKDLQVTRTAAKNYSACSTLQVKTFTGSPLHTTPGQHITNCPKMVKTLGLKPTLVLSPPNLEKPMCLCSIASFFPLLCIFTMR